MGVVSYRALGMVVALALICAAMAVLTSWKNEWGPSLFLSDINLKNILRQSTITTVAAVGMTLVIIAGGIDLSVGSVVALCSVVLAVVVQRTGSGAGVPLGVAACLGAGVLFGLLNGAVVVHIDAPPFIVTLGTMFIGRGLAYVIAEGKTIHVAVSAGSFAIPVSVTLGAVLLAHLFLSVTRLGRYVYATGGSQEAARLSGVPVGGVKLMTYVASGACAALGAVIYWVRMAAGNPLAQGGLELYAIAAAIVGGTSLSGGEGDVLGTLIGALIMVVLANGLGLLGVQDYWKDVITGSVIVIAVGADRLRMKWRARSR